MSHIAKIELEIRDLSVLKAACRRLPCTFVENRKSYRWYGRVVGTYPLPEGITEQDLGRCDHVLRVAGADYEIGVVGGNGRYHLLWDPYPPGGLEKVLGPNAGLLKQAYAVELVTRQARIGNYPVRECGTEQGIRLIVGLPTTG